MRYEIRDDGDVSIVASADEVLTLKHCVVEALEALGDDEFLIRTGGPKVGAEKVLTLLKLISADLHARGD
jgi:hypothetical protein